MTLVPIFAGKSVEGRPPHHGIFNDRRRVRRFAGRVDPGGSALERRGGPLDSIGAVYFRGGAYRFFFSRVLWVSMLLLVVAGFGFMIQMGASNTHIQTIVDDDKRGRVMSLFVMSWLGAAPIGSVVAGSLTETIGAPNTLMLGGFAVAWQAGFGSTKKTAQGRIRTYEGRGPPDLQSGAFDRSATCAKKKARICTLLGG
jgi:hypothetical protein